MLFWLEIFQHSYFSLAIFWLAKLVSFVIFYLEMEFGERVQKKQTKIFKFVGLLICVFPEPPLKKVSFIVLFPETQKWEEQKKKN